MNLSVDFEKKQEILAKVIEQTPHLRTLSTLSKWTFPVSVALAAIHAGTHLILPELAVVIVAGVPQKDIASIISRTVLLLIFGLLGRLFAKLLLANRASIDLTERTDEHLELFGRNIQYTFRTMYHSLPENRVIIKISPEFINSVEYDANKGKLVFHGSIGSTYVEQYEPAKDYPWDSNLSQFVLYDYFEPALLQHLQDSFYPIISAHK